MPHTVTDMDMAAFMGENLKGCAIRQSEQIPAYAFFGCAAESIQISST